MSLARAAADSDTDGSLPTTPDRGDSTGVRGATDAELMVAIGGGDGDAYAEIFRRHLGSVTAAVSMVLGRHPSCDDVATGVFLGLWSAPERFDPMRGSLLGYLRMTARGRSIDLVRSESSRRRREEQDVYAPRTPAPGLDAALLARETSREIDDALSRLPSDERQAIALAFFGGLSYVAVALQLGIPEGTVKSRIRSGLATLRRSEVLRDAAAIALPRSTAR